MFVNYFSYLTSSLSVHTFEFANGAGPAKDIGFTLVLKWRVTK